MGWDITADGFSVVLSAEIPNLVKREMRRDVDSFPRPEDSRSETSMSSSAIPEDRKSSKRFKKLSAFPRRRSPSLGTP